MDAILRSLQTRTDGDLAPLAVLLDDVHCIGGGPILLKLLEKLASSTSAAAAPARTLTIASLGQPPATCRHLPSLRIIDCWSDPHGWKKDRGEALSLFATDSSTNGLANLQSRLLDGLEHPPIVILDSLSPLIDAFGAPAVAATLNTLRHRSAGVIIALHVDLHPRSEVDALCYGAACVAELGPAAERPPPAPQPHGRLSVRVKRKSGMVKAETIEYRIENNNEIAFLKPLEILPAAATPSPADATATSLATMRLEVTEEEAAARERVQLPYEHQGQGQRYAAGVDFREYLPEAAGGRRRGQGRLGHILYVRDSDSEDPDSDEDPDDDLDV